MPLAARHRHDPLSRKKSEPKGFNLSLLGWLICRYIQLNSVMIPSTLNGAECSEIRTMAVFVATNEQNSFNHFGSSTGGRGSSADERKLAS